MVATKVIPAIFTPLRLGNVTLQHRVVMAPLTRFRADDDHVHQSIAEEYYAQRATPGGLIITESTYISEEAGGYENAPGIYNDAQIAAWKRIVDRVHAKGGFIYLQIWAMGRAADPEVLAKVGHKVVSASNIPMTQGGVPKPDVLEKNGQKVVAASDIPKTEGGPVPTPLSKQDIHRYVEAFAQAAKNAVYGAGFDGVEIHSANGYLPDQFLSSNSNDRTDEYGGSVENRSRFTLEIVKAVADAVTPERTAIRLSPHSEFQMKRMPPADLKEQFTHVVSAIAKQYPGLAYVHITEPRVNGIDDVSTQENTDFLREAWGEREGSVFLSAGGYSTNPKVAIDTVETYGGAVAFGRAFIPNPDLVLRLKYNVPLEAYDRSGFYDRLTPKGYIDYPFAPELAGKP